MKVGVKTLKKDNGINPLGSKIGRAKIRKKKNMALVNLKKW